MMEYILKLKSISDNLASVGEPVKERDHIFQLLGGLGSEYNPIVTSLTTRDEDLLFIRYIVYYLLMNRGRFKILFLQIFVQ